ncbi:MULTISPECIES: EamA family transporter [unclassified Isoptericola]|uniref:EamA family transporter n=1 Tax=unclassified Isoptericola TaxID=2623355 RepID=UPI0027127654|nr:MULTISPECIES: EamA family transporter [unclassified Isoptericola]MDO8144038.1 EamA family transporter [Isoptericola sp. 178]MDO8152401.1 EamA family transporter [Isoptericola sp. b408]
MPTRHRLLAALVALLWGLNFLAIDASLQHYPPLFLVALRFAVLAVPTVLLVPWPGVPVRWLIGYGLGFGVLQFTFLYWGMAAGMPAGLASLVLQASGPFTVVLGATFLRERFSGRQLVGILVAVAGLAVVGWQRAEHAAVLPFLLTLAGAFGWAIGNVCNRQARPRNPLHLALWMSVVPPLPMLAVSLLVEGPDRIRTSLVSYDDPGAVGAVVGLAYTVLLGTVAGSGLWTWLMSRHPAGVVAPFSMLVPVVGMTAAWLVLGETATPGELAGGVLVILGVLLGSRLPRPGSRPASGRRAGPRGTSEQRAASPAASYGRQLSS